MSLLLYVLFLAAQKNSVAATLDRWRAEIRAEVAAEDIYKPNKPLACAAHVIGIADLARDRHTSHHTTELRNKELKEQRKAAPAEQDQRRATMDRAAAALKSTKVGDVDRSRGGECVYNYNAAEALCNAQDALAYERARFRADCAARAIRTAADAETHMLAFQWHAPKW